VRAIREGAQDVEGAGSSIAEIACGSGPSVGVGLNESVAAKPAEDRGGVAGADSEDPGCAVDREGRMLAERRVELAGEVSEAGAGEQVVPLVSELVLQESDELGAMREQFRRGAGVIEWL
jgi:predicted nuclease with TOPRIM domain